MTLMLKLVVHQSFSFTNMCNNYMWFEAVTQIVGESGIFKFYTIGQYSDKSTTA